MIKYALPVLAVLALSACGETPTSQEDLEAPGSTEAAASVDFGDDTSQWSNDNECDDKRFDGPGMTSTPLLDEDIGHDATDCRTAFEAGRLQLREGAAAAAATPAAAPAAAAAAPAGDAAAKGNVTPEDEGNASGKGEGDTGK